MTIYIYELTNAVAEPGFPRSGGVNSPGGGGVILPKCPENCVKSKNFYVGGVCVCGRGGGDRQ